jgi:hypothetical protein
VCNLERHHYLRRDGQGDVRSRVDLGLAPLRGDLMLLARLHAVCVRVPQGGVALRRMVEEGVEAVVTSFTKTTSLKLGETAWPMGRVMSAELTRGGRPKQEVYLAIL